MARCTAGSIPARTRATSSGGSIARSSSACCSPLATRPRPRRARWRDRSGSRVADKVESQDICFVPDGDHTKIIRQRLGGGCAVARARPGRPHRRAGGGRARRTRALHHRAATRTPRWLSRADVRGGDPPGAPRGGHRAARGAARARRGRAGDELAGGRASVGARVQVQVRHRAPAAARRDRAARSMARSSSRSTNRWRRSRPGSRWWSTTVHGCSVVATSSVPAPDAPRSRSSPPDARGGDDDGPSRSASGRAATVSRAARRGALRPSPRRRAEGAPRRYGLWRAAGAQCLDAHVGKVAEDPIHA